jgi:hypothetical protein
MAGIAGLVAHVDDVVAFFDEVLASPPRKRVSFAALQSAARERRKRAAAADPVFVAFPNGRENYVDGIARIAFAGAAPDAWTSARADLESRWSSRDAIKNAIRKATSEGVPAREFAGRVAEIYGGWLERHKELVERDVIESLVARAIGDAAALGNLTDKAVEAIEALANDLVALYGRGTMRRDGKPIDAPVRDGFSWRCLRALCIAPGLTTIRRYAAILTHKAEGESDGGAADDGVVEMKRTKRGTVPGETDAKLTAALTDHHRYSHDSCLEDEPIGNNELARKAKVSQSTAKKFLDEKFGGLLAYRRACRDKQKLLLALKQMNGEIEPRHLLSADVAG